MTILEQKFMETVPMALRDIANELKTLNNGKTPEIKEVIVSPGQSQLFSKCSKIKDGVYLIRHDDTAVLFTGQGIPDTEKSLYKGVGVKLGCKSLVVATEDAVANNINLTKGLGGTRFITKYHDAVADWNGKENTADIRDILNDDILLGENEHIPSLGELYFILLHIRDINAALEAIGGKPLCSWYWTSTQYSAAYAWGLYLNRGYASGLTKASGQGRVRAVSAFPIAK